MAPETGFCDDHPVICGKIGNIEAGIEYLKDGLDRLGKTVEKVAADIWSRVNQHIDESPDWHSRIITLEKEVKERKEKEKEDKRNFLTSISITVAVITLIVNVVFKLLSE